ncbi:hypothetical protein [uncultured Algibacter sp.]|uniref:hypothetical protein n=1 Tax=uncultured Algibacter sp. TaxID=298659 RepID=UPI00260B8365|nr:hypothetical protein [uncultured Algibacter sp.]
MATNITYLLGAGASYNALPVVEGISNSLAGFANEFDPGKREHIDTKYEYNNPIKKHLSKNINDFEKAKNFHADIIWLKNETENHTSIDTFAKKLYLQDKETDLKKLKYILSCFFIYEQTFKFDKRYDSFFASVLDSLSEIPTNLKILSWNYDSQLEIAFSNFSNQTIEKSREVLNIFSKGNQIDSSKTNLNNTFNVFKVNGTTSIRDKENKNYDLILDYSVDKVKLVSSFLEIYSNRTLFSTHEPNMSFSWENFNENQKFYSDLRKSIENTDILIVVGYSFPFFNRKIDEFILHSMDNLKKIYVQDPYNADDIISKIKEMVPWRESFYHIGKDGLNATTKDTIKFIPIIFDKQFFIPIEF